MLLFIDFPGFSRSNESGSIILWSQLRMMRTFFPSFAQIIDNSSEVDNEFQSSIMIEKFVRPAPLFGSDRNYSHSCIDGAHGSWYDINIQCYAAIELNRIFCLHKPYNKLFIGRYPLYFSCTPDEPNIA